MITDTHCHLHMKEFDNDLEEVIKRALETGVSKIVTAGVDVATSQKGLEIAQNHPGVFAAVGVQPEEVDRYIDDELKLKVDIRKGLEALAQNKKVVAIGEIGLDYKWAREHVTSNHKSVISNPEGTLEIEIEKQKEIFRRQLGLAVTLDLPVIIHCREAEEDVLAEIQRYEETKKLRGVIHCFTGTEPFARKVLDAGFYISFSGIVTFPNAGNLRELVKEIPLDRILVETDSPLIAPQIHRGERNEPAYVCDILKEVATAAGLKYDDASRVNSENANRLFNLEA